MSLILEHPHTEVAKVIAFLKQTFQAQNKEKAVIAVSGGIDSALSLTMLAHALPKENIYPLLLPYGAQLMDDAREVCVWNGIPERNVTEINIKSAVEAISALLSNEVDDMRRGNLMARVRMILVYDMAKKLDALVVGTENKSEKYLAYFTRFGDEASDIEPIQHFYKTQVKQIAEHLNIPTNILQKEPSAGLWKGQTDEAELGFSYAQADEVISQYIDQGIDEGSIKLEGENGEEVVKKVISRITSQKFKHEVPYKLD